MMTSVLDAIRSVPPVVAYGLIALLVFGEAAVFVGFVLPGETGILLGGFLAHEGRLDLVTLTIIVVVGAVVGDTVGYEVGRQLGERLLRLRLFDRHRAGLDKARARLRRHGGPAILLARWTAFLRAVMPALAGLSRMRYATFLWWNAIGGISWGVTYCLVGYYAGASYAKVASRIGTGGAIVLAVLVIVAVVVWRVRRHRNKRAAPGDA